MKNNPKNKLNVEKCLSEIQKFVENERSPKDRINHLKRKIVHLGADTKKPFLNFKHIKMLKEHKYKKKQEIREKLKSAGVVSKKQKF